MVLKDRPVLGILELDEGLLPDSPSRVPRVGALVNPATFERPIITEMVEGATAEVVIRGEPLLEVACVAAAQRLVRRGASVISADCGYFIRHQSAVAAAVNVPVVMSSLLLVPALLPQLSPARKLAVVTADASHCHQDLLGVDSQESRARVVIGGIDGGEYLRNSKAHPFIRTEVDQIEKEVAACVSQLRADHPEIGMLLFECTGFPLVANAIRVRTGLPVYDITDLCRLTLASIDCDHSPSQ
ncbi:hypothetical protein [Mesorhizobium sp.]|uniref:hypothetical protein n=1 Tax=Mesorhizobium sp. TaxID=1871066 RepID=UPI0025DBDD54|nr:hypothetical protein [Mesorhizobium sp.]